MPSLDSGGGEGMGFSPGELPGIPAAPLACEHVRARAAIGVLLAFPLCLQREAALESRPDSPARAQVTCGSHTQSRSLLRGSRGWPTSLRHNRGCSWSLPTFSFLLLKSHLFGGGVGRVCVCVCV